MSDAFSLLALPFAASVAFVLIHAYLGVHVLRRNIIFADLALAQLSALGATVAFASGYAPESAAGYAYALLFTGIGAALLTLTRALARFMSREAFVGIVYVVATAATILVVDRAPQGAEHVKRILLGRILTVGPADVAQFAVLYSIIGTFCWFARRPLLAVSGEQRSGLPGGIAAPLWDFVFFLIFGLVVTSSVTTAGVLLVFSFLIVPPIIGLLFSTRLHRALPIAWCCGIIASAAGLGASFSFDLPTGAAMVMAFAIVLLLAGLGKALLFAPRERRQSNRRIAAGTASALALLCILASSLWLIAKPAGDQPLLSAWEAATGWGPEYFLDTTDRQIFEDAARDAVRFQAEVDRLNATERKARYQGETLSDDEIRRIASYQQSFSEMTRGEQFVRDVLRGKARARERWSVGVPAATIALVGFALLARPWWRNRRRRRDEGSVSRVAA
jgi:zinc/manganese transport system permease protein